MQSALYVEISAVGILLLIIVLLSQRQSASASASQRRFSHLIFATILMHLIDAGCWLIDGTQFHLARQFNYVLETCYYALLVVLPYLWALFVEGALSLDIHAASRRTAVATIPMIILLIALIPNLKYGFVFTIDAQNVYHRASSFYVYSLFCFAFLLYGSIRALIKARDAVWSDDRKRYYSMAFNAVLPFLGGVVQMFFYGVSLTWILVSVAILLVFLDSQNRQISTDPLTGLNNRRELSKYLLHEIGDRDASKNGTLALVMMDVDGFKLINDTYGHFYGDSVLVGVSEILKAGCKNTDAFLSRYGGDEFCIVLSANADMDPDEIIARVEQNVAEWNAAHPDMKPISLSIGYAVWNAQMDKSYETLLARADARMYEVKNAKKCA